MPKIPKLRARHLVPALGLAGAVAVAGVAIGAAPTQVFSGKVTPSTLPKHAFAPVTAKFNLDITSSDANEPPPMVTATAIFDNQVKVDFKHLAVCRPGKLEDTNAPQARKACKNAIIGRGFANAKVTFPDQAPIDAPAPITMFNGPPAGRNPRIIIHAFTTVPAPTTFIVPGVLRKQGSHQKITFTVPPIAGGYGTLVHYNASLGKKFKVGRRTHSYANAKCARGHISLEGDFTYLDGTHDTTDFSARCRGRK
jgi:hypothetical protein